jgi:hypothetical protein
MTDGETALRELLAKGTDASVLREMIGFAAERLMELEIGGMTGRPGGPSRSLERRHYRADLVRRFAPSPPPLRDSVRQGSDCNLSSDQEEAGPGHVCLRRCGVERIRVDIRMLTGIEMLNPVVGWGPRPPRCVRSIG